MAGVFAAGDVQDKEWRQVCDHKCSAPAVRAQQGNCRCPLSLESFALLFEGTADTLQTSFDKCFLLPGYRAVHGEGEQLK